MKLRSSDVLNLVTSKLQNTTGPVKLGNMDAHTFPKSLFNRAGVNALLLILVSLTTLDTEGEGMTE